MEEKILQIFRDITGRELIEGEIAVNTLEEWDSLYHLNLVLALEEEFAISISPDEIKDLYSDFNTVVDFVKSKLQR